MEKDKQINFRLGTSYYNQLKSEAIKRGLNIAQIVRIFIQEGLSTRCPDFCHLDAVRTNYDYSDEISKVKEKREKILFKAAVESVLLCRSLLSRTGGEELVKEHRKHANILVDKNYPDFNA